MFTKLKIIGSYHEKEELIMLIGLGSLSSKKITVIQGVELPGSFMCKNYKSCIQASDANG